ncbi:MAG TPA: hypothetical protein VFR37_00515 [Longimicrobium sp.]|nr:hypothetical protein [Longimicrobium sp.]
MKSLRLPVLAALILAACSSPAPTGPSAFDATSSLDEGPGMMGSGNAQGTGTGGYTGESTVSSDSVGRGGNTLGSGN